MAGPEALEIYNAFTWDEEADKKKVDKIMKKFEAYCTPRKNVTWDRYVFNSRSQQPGERIDQYVTDLRSKAAQCEFGTLTDSLIRDRIVCGVLSDRTRSRLLKDAGLTLDGAIDICRADEATAARMKSLATGEKDPSDKDLDLKLLKKGTMNSHAGDRQGQRTGAKQQKQFGNCGGRHTPQQKCPAIDTKCYKCGRRNHYAKVCHTKNPRGCSTLCRGSLVWQLTFQISYPTTLRVAAPLRILLEKDTEWHWSSQQEESLQELKNLITHYPILKFYDPRKPTTISVDASSKGIGAVLLREDGPIAYASKSLMTSQRNYAQIEKEMFAIVFGCTKFHDYVYGLPNFHLETDHKPLESILRKPLHQAPARLQRMIMSIQKYPITVEYKAGTQLFIADTLFRAPLSQEASELEFKQYDINALQTLPISESIKTEYSQIGNRGR